MSIGLDYLRRKGLIQEFLSIPCSIFATDKFNGNRMVFTVDKSDNKHLVKKWDIYRCKSTNVLPPLEEFISENAFNDDRILQENYSILEFRHKGMPTHENSYNHPMPSEKFDLYFDGYMKNFSIHIAKKERWLWNSFLSTYHPDIILFGATIKRSLKFFGMVAENEILRDQKSIIENHYHKSWKAWGMWRKHMLDFKGPPGELFVNVQSRNCYTVI